MVRSDCKIGLYSRVKRKENSPPSLSSSVEIDSFDDHVHNS